RRQADRRRRRRLPDVLRRGETAAAPCHARSRPHRSALPHGFRGHQGAGAVSTETLLPVAILAGGLATRMHAGTQTIPKSLIEVARRPFIDHQLELLRAEGITNVVLCVGYLGEMIEAHVGDG